MEKEDGMKKNRNSLYAKQGKKIVIGIFVLFLCISGGMGIIFYMRFEQSSALQRNSKTFTSRLFGENVYVISPKDDPKKVQVFLEKVWERQEKNQFGNERYAIYFLPGTYDKTIQVKLGFYTQVAGLGTTPDETSIKKLQVNARWLTDIPKNHNALCNFWRGAENLTIRSNTMWAVSQATELRNVNIKGSLFLHDENGWASGGFVSDTSVKGIVDSGSQQQFLFLNSDFKEWLGENWNLVFVGEKKGAAPQATWPVKSYTTIDTTPVKAKKPYLIWEKEKGYEVYVPGIETQISGVQKVDNADRKADNKNNSTNHESTAKVNQNSTKDRIFSLDKFYIATAKKDTAKTINEQLEKGKNLILTPGIYHLTEPIVITHNNTIVLGMGYATLVCDNKNAAMLAENVIGCSISGLLFDAGKVESEHLLYLKQDNSKSKNSKNENMSDETSNTASNTASNTVTRITDANFDKTNATTLHDLFFRVGGTTDAYDAKTKTCVEIQTSHVIGDNFWIWRADHGDGVGWDKNTADTGISVLGDDVTLYGLMVEHFEKYQTIWEGKNGSIYMYQSEFPYDVPNQDAWKSKQDTVQGYPSIYVGENASNFLAAGLGIYSYNRDAKIKIDMAMEIKNPSSCSITNICTVMLNGNPGILHIINTSGKAVTKAGEREILKKFPIE